MAVDYSKLSDEELKRLIERQDSAKAAFSPQEPTGFRKAVDSSGLGTLLVDIPMEFTKGAISAAGKTLSGAANTVDSGVRAAQSLTDKPETGSATLQGIGDEAAGISNSLDASARPGYGAVKLLGTAAGMPGGLVTGGLQAGAQSVKKGDPWWIAAGKIGLGYGAAKGLGAIFSGAMNAGQASYAAHHIGQQVMKEGGDQAVNAAFKTLANVQDDLRQKASDVFAEGKPKWVDQRLPTESQAGWNVLRNDPYVSRKIGQLEKLSTGDESLGYIAQQYQDSPAGSIGKLDAVKQMMNKKSFNAQGVPLKPSAEYTESVVRLDDLLKSSSPEYAKTLSEAAPFLQSKREVGKLVNSKSGEVDLNKIFTQTSGKNSDVIFNNLKPEQKAVLAQGYLADRISKSGTDINSMSTGKALDTMFPNRNVVENLKKLMPDDAATIDALWKAKIAVKPDGSKLVETAGKASTFFGTILETVRGLSTAKDTAFVKALEESGVLPKSPVKDILGKGIAASVSVNTTAGKE